MVVSNIDLTTNLPVMKPSTFLESSVKDFILNINNDYRYLKTGYYVSLHAEILGNPVIPSSENIIDAYRTPILLLRASKAGIPTIPYIVTDSAKQIISHFNFPVVTFAVNPFSCDGYKIAKNRSALYRALKSLGMNYKFDVCAQPLLGNMLSFKSIFGKCDLGGAIEKISARVYEAFKIPVCKLHVQCIGKEAYLCGLQPLKREEISLHDLRIISDEISRISGNGDPLIV
ncbi:MAG: RimK-like ATPgrasp N-terminal domain-containing protein [Candidatus Bathycorpusculaceae bacterium]